VRRGRYAEEHRFGPVCRIPTPTPYPGLGDINSYLILPGRGSGPVLIDTGVRSDLAWDALRSGLREFGLQVSDLELVLLTHAHPDHCGQGARIAEAAGCQLWIHEDAFRTLARYGAGLDPEHLAHSERLMRRFGVPDAQLEAGLRMSRSGSLDLFEPFEAGRLLRDGDRIEIPGFPLEVVHTPGHCPEELIYWQPDQRLIFSGDHLLPDITPICLMHVPQSPGEARISTLLQYRTSLEKAEALDAATTFPSHGDLIDDHRALCRSYRLHMEKRTLKLARLLKEGGEATVFELGCRMFPHVWREQLFLVLSETIGHLDLLESERRIALREEGGALRYRLLEGVD
jgi:glyoxylase-like metal-dependent hydrolase (beta-lactamase superfamily II)